MSDSVQPTSLTPKEAPPPSTLSEAATGGVSSAPAPQGDGHFSNMTQLKNQAPEVYDAIVKSLAQNICSQWKDSADRLKQIMKEGQDRG